MTTRSDVVVAAYGWLGTPFHHQARLKGVGVDCIGVPIGISRELGLVEPTFDITAYSRLPDGVSLMAYARQYMVEHSLAELQAGMCVVVAFDADPQHFGVVVPYRHGGFSIIHAASTAKKVVETRLMFGQHMRFVAGFDLPGVTS